MKKQFTLIPLCDVNGVKYDIKRQKCPCVFTPSESFFVILPLNQISINLANFI
jgi:hypothetical protein